MEKVLLYYICAKMKKDLVKYEYAEMSLANDKNIQKSTEYLSISNLESSILKILSPVDEIKVMSSYSNNLENLTSVIRDILEEKGRQTRSYLIKS